MTLEQYLETERAADFRHEYIDGLVAARPASTSNHVMIATAAACRIHEQLEDKPFAVVGSDLLIWCDRSRVVTYADVVVFPLPAKSLDSEDDVLLDATVIMEVLSQSEAEKKLRFYQGLPSFAEYVRLEESAIHAEHHIRQPDGLWLYRESNGADAELELQSISCRLNLGSLYERVKFKT